MKIQLSNRVSTWSILPNAALHGKILELQNAGEEIIDLTIGISDLPIPEVGKKAAISTIKNNIVPYTAVSGDSGLKRAIQQKLKTQNKISAEFKNIIVSTGAKQAIFQALFVLTNPGDKVVLIKPYWPAYTQTLKMLKLEPFVIDINDIANINNIILDAKVKVLLFDLPHNPTGKVFTRKELGNFVSFAKKNNLLIIADESYEKLIYEGEQITLATLDKSMQNNILTTFSVSQSFSMMGWRLGYSVGNEEIISAMEAVQSSITAATPYVSQKAVSAILNTSDEYTSKLVHEFKKRRNAIYPKLNKIDWLMVENPASGPYFWCNIEKITKNSLKFSQRFLEEQKIAVMPGEPFGTPGWIRVAFNVQPTSVLEDAVKRLALFGKTYGKRT